ncbi:ABC transporter ATP-binding protein/permease [bacterium]|nr:ABC transporter ATP-binding protein [Candidatus Omnitrophota bacterium]MBU2527786.1 ABC transporter ATP-binding protein/permease [bacterium]MBU3930414.1 ABC transporter ATP-binding protein/permease [bacterium]MBU4123265.1 ABC transporter ATP-binding protein/permease [bacterium]
MKTKDIMKRLAVYLKPYRIRFVEALLCMIVVAAIKSGRVYLLKPGLDKLIESRNANLVILFSAALIVLTVIHAVFSYIQNYLLAYIGQRVIIDVRNETYSHMQNLSLDYYIKRTTGALLSRLTNDMMYVQNAITSVPVKLIRDGLSCAGLLVVLFALNWQWTLASLIFFPLIMFPIKFFARKMRKTSRQTQEKMAQIYALLAERISGIKVTKAFAREKREIERMEESNKDYFNVIMRLLRAETMQRPVLEIITYTISLVIGAYVINAIFRETVSVGTAVAYLAALINFYAPIKSLADLNKMLQSSLSASERIFRVLDADITVKEKPGAKDFTGLKNSISFENVSFSYFADGDGDRALKNINLQIKKGSICALVGSSGGGKTTIANLIPRFFDPTEGRIAIDGADIRDFKLAQIRRSIGIVSQDIMLFRDSVRNNISYGVDNASEEDVIRAAKLANAYDFIREMPLGFDTIIGERGATLSGGQAQRICIARAVIMDPPILILDEATSALDTESEMQIQKALDAIVTTRTTVVIAHRLSTVRRADNIAVISSGEVVESGRHDELLKKNGYYSRLYNIQFKIQ